ncbi:MAG: hypothetical protein FWE47_04220, partial [Oscillospiraceae bacterium]|nr:hypothetical protein [Oscillospiraceae bacterium]
MISFGGVFKTLIKVRRLRKLVLKLANREDATELLKKGCLPCCKYYSKCAKSKNINGTTHHIYFPKRWYQTEIEIGFRELPKNKIVLCRGMHEDFHKYFQPPKKPSVKKIIAEIELHDEDKANKKLHREIRKANGNY